jgi:hypothetical protein
MTGPELCQSTVTLFFPLKYHPLKCPSAVTAAPHQDLSLISCAILKGDKVSLIAGIVAGYGLDERQQRFEHW